MLRRLSVELIDCERALIPRQFFQRIDLEPIQDLLGRDIVISGKIEKVLDLLR